MSKTLNLIIVDDALLVKPLAERLGFKDAEDLSNVEANVNHADLITVLRDVRAYMPDWQDRLYYFVISTDNLMLARGIGGHHHTHVALEAANLPRNLDVEFDRIMLATGYERFVVKERHSHFEGWHKHHNESRLMPLPEGGHVKINDEDPDLDPRFRLPSHRVSMKEPHESTQPVSPGVLTMKPEYLFAPGPSDPNRPRWNWVMIDDVARLDEWAQRLNILNFKPLSDVLNKGLVGTETAMAAALIRNENVAKIYSSLTEHTTFYTIAPEEMLKAAFISLDYSNAVLREACLPSSMLFIPRNAAYITKDYFTSVRGDRGDNWAIHNKHVAPEAKNFIIGEAHAFAVRVLGNFDLPATYNGCTPAPTGRLHRGLATTINEEWVREQTERMSSGKHIGTDFFNLWTTPNNSFLDEETIKRLRDKPSLGEKGSFSRDLFTEAQLEQMSNLIPDVFLPDGTIDIGVLSKFYESKASLIAPGLRRRRLFPRSDLGIISESTIEGSRTDLGLSYLTPIPAVYESGQSVLEDNLAKSTLMMLGELGKINPLPVMPAAVLDTINKYLDEKKDAKVFPLDDVEVTAGDDGHTLLVTFTTRDPEMARLIREAGGQEVAKPTLTFVADVANNDVAESYPLGRGLTEEAARQLFREQNPHLVGESRPVDWAELARIDKPTAFPPKDSE